MIGKWVPKWEGGWDPWIEKLVKEEAVVVVDEEMGADRRPEPFTGIGIPTKKEEQGKLIKGYFVSQTMWEEIMRRYGK